jgi:glycosyltransferase involved in cell wall biosynthesis
LNQDDRTLRVAVIAHVRHPIAAPFMGGMEAHCDLLVRALIRRGHQVTLFASGDSAPDLPLHPITATAYERELPWALWHGRPELRAWLMRAYQRAWQAVVTGGFDVVHNNSLFPELHDWAARDGVPMLTSLHVPPFRFLRESLERADVPWLRQTVTSASQLPLWPTLDPDRLDVAWNGIDLANWPYRPDGNGRAVWFGRITPNKGTVLALKAASAAGIGLDVIGPIECEDYFAGVAPLLTGPHRYLGQLSGPDLAARVGQASVMLATPMWDEPFGLTVAEAMACGVPVAALDRGAMREVIGDTGTIATDPAALPDAILQALRADRPACRDRVETLFTADAMVARYEAAYAATLAGTAIRASNIRNTLELLA